MIDWLIKSALSFLLAAILVGLALTYFPEQTQWIADSALVYSSKGISFIKEWVIGLWQTM